MTRSRSYSELRRLSTFEERYAYLRIGGNVGVETFGFDRFLNQQFYASREWKTARRDTIARDLGCDLGISDRVIYDRIYIHHMNPMRAVDLTEFNPDVLDPEFLICVTHRTHNAIHYGDDSLLLRLPPERRPGDTNLW